MRKVQIIGPKGFLDECIRALHSVAVVHIETPPAEYPVESILQKLPLEKEKLAEKERLERAARMLNNLVQLLKAPQSYTRPKILGSEMNGFLADIATVDERVRALHAGRHELEEELSRINRYEKLLRGFTPIVSRLSGLKNFEITGLTIEKSKEEIVKLLNSEVERITQGNYQIYVRDLDESTIGVVLTYMKKFGPGVRHLLSAKEINEIRLPDEYAGLTLVNALKKMELRKAELPGLIDGLEKELADISRRWYGTTRGLIEAVEDTIDEVGAVTYAAQTKFAFVIEGWVPDDMFALLKERFLSLFGDRILVRELQIEAREVDLIPVYIANPGILKPFEVFLLALPLPRYGSVDPTPYIALFFPAFFGLIVGDIGYGTIILILSLYLRRRFREKEIFHNIFSILSICGLSTVVFGFLFGEFFGDLGVRLGVLRPILFDRAEALKTLMVLTLGIGLGHILLGIIISIVNHLYRGRTREAGARIFYLLVIVLFISILGIMFGYLPAGLLTPGVIALVISFALLVTLEGILGPIEFIKALGNILSYVRIMAVGTASVVMAIVANRIGGLSKDLVLGIIAAGLIHTLNILLSVLSPTIQSMRLHYVEFFSKFYAGGGKKYTPFRKR